MFHVKRFKTGTSPRVLRASINTAVLSEQTTNDMNFRFSRQSEFPVANLEKCWVARTTGKTEAIVKESLRESPLYTGMITGKGPRYCPSFEDKVTRFPDRTAHPIHLEPTGRNSRIMYLNGLSTSLPEEIQERVVRSLDGFEDAVVSAFGYSVEYTCFETGEFNRSLRLRGTENLFAAGQILGTSGYEEAAAAGFLAGANAAGKALGKKEQEPDRMSSYLGVMVDDLVTSGAEEPYRLFSSRSENRLFLRQDNADERTYGLGLSLETLSPEAVARHENRKREHSRIERMMKNTRHNGETVEDICKRPETTVSDAASLLGIHGGTEVLQSAVLDVKYSGYISRARRKNLARERYRQVQLSDIGDFSDVISMCTEAAQVLNTRRPMTIGDAEKLSGVRQADMEALVLHLMKRDVSRETG
jgi:tRNA uridine 5-carboxymethylaminomethyl modification enzyme